MTGKAASAEPKGLAAPEYPFIDAEAIENMNATRRAQQAAAVRKMREESK